MNSTRIWTGRVLSAFAAAFLLVDGGMKLMRAPVSVEATVGLGYPASDVFAIGALLIVCTVLYAIPRTAVLGAVLLTGFLGGAVATQVRAGNPLFSHALFPVYVGAMAWGGLYLRDSRLRAII